MKKIAFISLSGSNAQHNCVYGLVKCFLEDDYPIDFYMPPQYRNEFGIADPDLNFIQPAPHPYLWSLAKEYRQKYRVSQYDLTIFLDNPSLKLFPWLQNAVNQSVYFQLEITDRKFCRTISDRLLKLMEIYAAPRVSYLITQDLWRAAYCAGEFRIPLERFIIIPNSPLRVVSEIPPGDFVRERYGVPEHKVIVGYIGMIDEYTVPGWLIDQLSADDNIQYFFHTHVSNHLYFRKIKSRLEKVAIVSADFLPSNEISRLYAGLDIGLAIGDYQGLDNKYTSVNQALSGYSYGKINWYLALGKPVVYSPKLSFSFLNTSNCGIPLNSGSSLKVALKTIISKYEHYSGNCRQYFVNNLSLEQAYSTAVTQIFPGNDK